MSEYSKEEQQEAYKNIAQVRIFTLAQIMKIINTAQTRGAFQASEMTFVGSIYDSISKGVNQAMLKAREDLTEEQVPEKVYQEQVQEPTSTEIVQPQIYNPEVPVFQPKPKKEKKDKKSKKSKKDKKNKVEQVEHVEHVEVEIEHVEVEPERSHEPVEEFLEDSSDESEYSE
jgi:hypothetical protein